MVDRVFGTGAKRDTDNKKPDYEGYLSPLVIKRYGEYMLKNTFRPDGSVRKSDNWQKGIPIDSYMKSLWRHFMTLWEMHRGEPNVEEMEEAICGIMFNSMGYLHEVIK